MHYQLLFLLVIPPNPPSEVPEPSTYAMLTLGAALIAASAWRNQRRRKKKEQQKQ